MGHNRGVKRWQGAIVAVLLSCFDLFLHRSSSAYLLQDSDTNVLLAAIRTRHAPFSWFTGDWPLQNHFYRPVSTLAFELDNALYANHAAGYGLTNALLCILCVLLLFWFVRELTDSPLLSGASAVLFALQHLNGQDLLVSVLTLLAWGTIIVGILRHQLQLKRWLPAALVLLYAQFEIAASGITNASNLGGGTMGWIPGRTATVMTVFALASMAAYVRYERLSAVRNIPSASPLDPPATKSPKQRRNTHSTVVVWPLLSLAFAALALGSYEQAVMLPGVIFGLAVAMRLMGYQVRWGWQAGYWAMLIGYIVLRRLYLPSGASGYQLQQFRAGPGVGICILGYLLPCANGLTGFLQMIDSGLILLLTIRPYAFLLSAASTLTALYQAKRRWVFALTGYALSFVAYLPMAWVKTFAHYNYWPMAIRSLFTVTLLWVAVELIVIACSPQSQQAPRRQHPAPGSLLHP